MEIAIIALIAFISGCFAGVYFLRLGMCWGQKTKDPEAQPTFTTEDLPILPTFAKDPESSGSPPVNPLKEWFLGAGGDKQ